MVRLAGKRKLTMMHFRVYIEGITLIMKGKSKAGDLIHDFISKVEKCALGFLFCSDGHFTELLNVKSYHTLKIFFSQNVKSMYHLRELK